MNKQINLIPSELRVPAKLVKLSATLNKVSIIGAILLVFFAILIIGGLVYYNLGYKKTLANIDVLEIEIQELQSNEQRLVLIKDKLSKISYIKKLILIDDEIIKFDEFRNQLSLTSNVILTDIGIDPDKTEATLSFQNITDLESVLRTITNQSIYKKAILASLTFNPTTGYLANIMFNND